MKDGSTTGLEFPDGPGAPRLAAGDRVRLARTTDPQTGGPAYVYDDEVRDLPLGLLAVGFAVVVVAVARWRGLAALAGLGLAYGVLVLFVLPALLAGKPALPVGLVASAAILYAVLYLAHGPSARTSAALAGTLLSLALTGVLAALATGASRITGLSSEQLPALEEAVRTLVGGIGLVAAVPITTALAVATVTRRRPRRPSAPVSS